MRFLFMRRLAGAFTGCIAGLSAATCFAGPIPIDDIARLPQVSDVSLSRDGRYLTALVPAKGAASEKPSIAVWDLDNPGKGPVIANANSDAEFIGVQALKSGRILAIARKPFDGNTLGCDGEGRTGMTRTYTYKLFFTDVRLKKFKDPFALSGTMPGYSEQTKRCLEIAVTGSVESGLLTLDPENIVVSEFDIRTYRTEYKKYNMKTNHTQLLFKDSDEESADLLDPRDATVWTKTKHEFDNGAYKFETLIRDAETGSFDVHDNLTWTSKERNTVNVVGRDEATGKFYVVTDQFSDRTEVYFYDPVKREYDKPALFSHKKFSATDVILGRTSSDFNKLLGFKVAADIDRIYWIDPVFAKMTASLEAALPDRDITILDYSADRSKILFMAGSSDAPPAYYVIANGKDITPIGASRPWIKPEDASKTSLVYYKARDGLSIPAFFTPPVGWSKGDPPAPAVVLPHGGPWARDYADWDPTGWVQFFASRGFAVLQPQYRGSEGWRRSLWTAGDAQWGLKMQDDKDDGANWMVAQGYADPERMIIFGYSYGGFAAFAASVREGGPFKCAIAGAGVSDLTRIGRSWSENRLQRFLQGFTVRGMDPLKNADKISMPILIFHGDRDVRVPLFHSTEFYDKVKDKTDATLVVIEDMPHQLPWTPTQQRKSLNAIEAFLATDCKL